MGGKDGISSGVTFVSKVLNVASVSALVAMMLLTVTDVFLRYTMNRPIVGSTEVTEYMMVFLTLGIPLSILTGRSIRMDLLVQRLSKRSQYLLELTTSAIGLFFAALLTFQLVKDVSNVKAMGIVSNTLRVPAYPFYLVMGCAFFVLDLVMVLQFVHRIKDRS